MSGTKKSVWRRAGRALLQMLAVLGILIGLLLVLGLYVALQPRTDLTGCTVTSIDRNEGGRRTLPSLTVHSSCGDFSAPTYYSVVIESGSTYDFIVRGWSWERLTIVDADRIE